jgi:hypothetical protein
MDVNARLWAARGPHADTRLRGDARRRDGSLRQELAAEMNHSMGVCRSLDSRLTFVATVATSNRSQHDPTHLKVRSRLVGRLEARVRCLYLGNPHRDWPRTGRLVVVWRECRSEPLAT